MRYLLLVALLLGIGTTTPELAAQTPAPRPADPDRDAVQQFVMQLGENINRNDFAALEAFFPARGVHILTDSVTTHGWAEYRDQHLKPELARFTGLRYEHTSIEPVVRGNVAWVAFRRIFTSTGPAGSAQGRGSAVLEKREGRWIIVHLHMST